MTTPTPYGWYHLLSILLTILAAIFLCKSNRFKGKETIQKTVFIVSIITILFEVYKQFNFSFSLNNGDVVFDYQWYAFPFQFCSTPMYVGALTGLFKNGKIHDMLYAYLATYAVFAGICVMVYPVTVFVPTIGINIQTMFNHGSMIVLGAYLLWTGYVNSGWKTVIKALPVFVVAIMLAIVMNEAAFRSGLLNTNEFNMFFISPYCPPSLPVYSLVQEVLPFPLCLLVYVAVFTLAGGLISWIFGGLKRLCHLPHSSFIHDYTCKKNGD